MGAIFKWLAASLLLSTLTANARPVSQTGVGVANEIRFHTGQLLSEVKLGYTTLGHPAGELVVILCGTAAPGDLRKDYREQIQDLVDGAMVK